MARIAGVDLPQNKQVLIGLTYIHGIGQTRSRKILAAADVIRDREVTTIPKCRFDAEVCGAVYREQPVVRSGNLICARGKRDLSAWMKQFVQMLGDDLGQRTADS